MDKPDFVPSCGTCRYRSDGPHVNADRGTAEFPDTMFACKRRAPVVTGGMMSNTMTIWPMVTKTDYCGEYESSEAWAAAQSQPAAEPVDVREVPDESVPDYGETDGQWIAQHLRDCGMAIVYREGPRNAE